MTVRRWILGLGIVLTGMILLLIGIYKWKENLWKVQAIMYPNDIQTDVTLEGYEDGNELLKYMFYQIGEKNLDYALRGCAFQNIAECFCLDYYTEYLNRFENTELIPPSDADSPAYMAITNARLSAGYARALMVIMETLQDASPLELLKIEDDVPESPDGIYYQNIQHVYEILGARSLEEKVIYLKSGERTMELRCTLVRYRKYWKVLFFHSLQDDGIEQIDLRPSSFQNEKGIPVESYKKDVLPCNYYLLNDNNEDNPDILIKRFFVYLQQEDAQSAMSYMDIDGTNQETELLIERLEHQEQMACQIQEFYYRTLLHDREYVRWISKDISERGSELTKALSTTNMLFTQIAQLEEVQNDGHTALYKFYWSYENSWIGANIYLENKNGWKITYIEYV